MACFAWPIFDFSQFENSSSCDNAVEFLDRVETCRGVFLQRMRSGLRTGFRARRGAAQQASEQLRELTEIVLRALGLGLERSRIAGAIISPSSDLSFFLGSFDGITATYTLEERSFFRAHVQ